MENFLNRFNILNEREEYRIIIDNIIKGVSFRGTNLWILIFAIFIASLGLNVNSTAVIIGAMLISPLMGPIMGIGLALGINDLNLLRKAIFNFAYAVGVGLLSSTIYFFITPINNAHSELLARTYPTIYDVLIAFFGGLAGIVATSSKVKGNVIPGVAIATALMPPLCTAGFGLATLNWNYFFGALYLFLINTVFIGAATFFTVQLLKFPHKHLPDAKADLRVKRIIYGVLMLTLIPSIYFGYDIVQQDRFNKNVNRFLDLECNFPNDYLLNKKIDAKHKTIELVFGGAEIVTEEIEKLKSKLANYDLENATLTIKQGFSSISENNASNTQIIELGKAISEKDFEINNLRHSLDSIQSNKEYGRQIFSELKIEYPEIKSVIVNNAVAEVDSTDESVNILFVFVESKKDISKKEREKIEAWLKVRLQVDKIKIIFE